MYPPWSLIKRAALSGVPLGRWTAVRGVGTKRSACECRPGWNVAGGRRWSSGFCNWSLEIVDPPNPPCWSLLRLFYCNPPINPHTPTWNVAYGFVLVILSTCKVQNGGALSSYAPMPGVKSPRYVTGMPIIDPGITYLFGVSVLMFLNTRIRARC